MQGLPELFTEMDKLYFNKSHSLQEKRQHIYIRSAVHVIYLTTTALASRCYPAVYTLVAVVRSPFWSQSTETQQVFASAINLLKGGGLGLGDLYWSLPAGDVQCRFSNPSAHQVTFA